MKSNCARENTCSKTERKRFLFMLSLILFYLIIFFYKYPYAWQMFLLVNCWFLFQFIHNASQHFDKYYLQLLEESLYSINSGFSRFWISIGCTEFYTLQGHLGLDSRYELTDIIIFHRSFKSFFHRNDHLFSSSSMLPIKAKHQPVFTKQLRILYFIESNVAVKHISSLSW